MATTDAKFPGEIAARSPLADLKVGAEAPSVYKTAAGAVPAEASTSTYESIPDDMTPVGEPTELMAALQEARASILSGMMGQTGSVAYGVTLPPVTPMANPTVPATFALPSAPLQQISPQAGSATIVLAQAGVGLCGFSPQGVKDLATLGRPRLAGAS